MSFYGEIEKLKLKVKIIFCIMGFLVLCFLVETTFIVKHSGNSPAKGISEKVYKVACTAYNPVPEQTDSTPRITSIGTRVKENYTIAVSQDLLKKGIVRYGDTIYIYELQKSFSVEDCTHERYNNRLDILMESKTEALKFGLKIVHFSILRKEK